MFEPDARPAAKQFRTALMKHGIPYASFTVDDITGEYQRLLGCGVLAVSRGTRRS